MSSRKPSAKARRLSEMRSALEGAGGGIDDLFARESQRRDELAARHDEALYEKACASKNRYASRGDAEEAIRLCAEHGRRGLRYYKCSYCGGWHLTSKPGRP